MQEDEQPTQWYCCFKENEDLVQFCIPAYLSHIIQTHKWTLYGDAYTLRAQVMSMLETASYAISGYRGFIVPDNHNLTLPELSDLEQGTESYCVFYQDSYSNYHFYDHISDTFSIRELPDYLQLMLSNVHNGTMHGDEFICEAAEYHYHKALMQQPSRLMFSSSSSSDEPIEEHYYGGYPKLFFSNSEDSSDESMTGDQNLDPEGGPSITV
jgi:hypothetical protein